MTNGIDWQTFISQWKKAQLTNKTALNAIMQEFILILNISTTSPTIPLEFIVNLIKNPTSKLFQNQKKLSHKCALPVSNENFLSTRKTVSFCLEIQLLNPFSAFSLSQSSRMTKTLLVAFSLRERVWSRKYSTHRLLSKACYPTVMQSPRWREPVAWIPSIESSTTWSCPMIRICLRRLWRRCRCSRCGIAAGRLSVVEPAAEDS